MTQDTDRVIGGVGTTVPLLKVGRAPDPDGVTPRSARTPSPTPRRVRGVEGPRIGDVPVMLTLPRGNTHAPTITVAEAAEEIRKSR